MKKKLTKLIITFIFLVVFVCFDIYLNNIDNNKKINIITPEEIIENNEQEVNYKDKFDEIKREYNNNDIVGILSLENTDLNELVVQYTDNDYYLNHDINNKSNWRGQTYLDYRFDINNSKKLIIYSHNSSNYVLPFKVFENYYDSDYLKEHKYMYLQTETEIKKYEIFSVHVETSDWSYFSKIRFNSDTDYLNHLTELKNKSIYDTGVEINEKDEILIIQTCSTNNDYKNYENKYLLVIGKRIDKNK